jgi:acyl transferase domain-containing protein
MDELAGYSKEEGIFARKLHVPVAYHSPHMDKVAEALREPFRVLEEPIAGKGQPGQ